MSDQSKAVTLGIVWGVPAIAKAIGRTERAVYHMVEKGELPGTAKIAGRWAFDPVAFMTAMRGEPVAPPLTAPQPHTNGNGHAAVPLVPPPAPVPAPVPALN